MRNWSKQLALVFTTFTVLGCCTALLVFWSAPKILSGTLQAGIAAGVGGAMGWGLVCGKRSQPAWWRTLLAGIAAGIFLHPVYLILAMLSAGELLTLSQFIFGSMFFLMIGGVITVPAGIVAATVCRILGRDWIASAGPEQAEKPPLATVSVAADKPSSRIH